MMVSPTCDKEDNDEPGVGIRDVRVIRSIFEDPITYMDEDIIDSVWSEDTRMPPRPLISYYDQALKLLSNRPHA